jgi:hypothetical protein
MTAAAVVGVVRRFPLRIVLIAGFTPDSAVQRGLAVAHTGISYSGLGFGLWICMLFRSYQGADQSADSPAIGVAHRGADKSTYRSHTDRRTNSAIAYAHSGPDRVPEPPSTCDSHHELAHAEVRNPKLHWARKGGTAAHMIVLRSFLFMASESRALA